MLSDNMRGALLMMASMACFTINDSFIKLVLEDVPLFQAITIRGGFAVGFTWLLAKRMGALDFRIPRRDWLLIGLRCLSEIAATFCFLTALSHMPLANVSAVLQVLPLTVTLGAVLFFGEGIGWRRSLAIGLGFCGVMLIIQPGTDGFSYYSIYAMGAVLSVTVRDLVTRRMSGQVPSMLVTLLAAVTVLVVFSIGSLSVEWVPITTRHLGLLVGAAVFIIGGYQFSVAVMRVGEVSFIAPFRYTSLLWALVLGWLIFDDWPDSVTMLGAAIVVVSGLFMFYREKVVSNPE